jgi:DNA-binding Xre family transcriptional regulator
MIVLKIQRFAETQGVENANQLAMRTGLPAPMAWKIWNQMAIPTLPTLNQLCEAFGCQLDDLAVYVEGEEPIHWAKKNDPLLKRLEAKGRSARSIKARA